MYFYLLRECRAGSVSHNSGFAPKPMRGVSPVFVPAVAICLIPSPSRAPWLAAPLRGRRARAVPNQQSTFPIGINNTPMNIEKGEETTTRSPHRRGSFVEPLAPSVDAPISQLCRHVAALEIKLDQLKALLSGHHKEYLTVEEVAALTGRAEFTVRRWIREGKLRAIRIAEGGPRGRLLISRAEIERIIATGKGGSVPDAAVVHGASGTTTDRNDAVRQPKVANSAGVLIGTLDNLTNRTELP